MKIHLFYWILISLIIMSCATSGLLRFQDRELLIHPDKPGLGYPHKEEECKKNWLGIKTCKEVQKDVFYDLNIKQVRVDLINAGFTCKSKMRFKY